MRECEKLGVIIDLAHINPAGFEEILSITTKPPVVSHTNVRSYYDIERNISDEQIKMIGERRGVIGVNCILVSPREEESTLDHYVDGGDVTTLLRYEGGVPALVERKVGKGRVLVWTSTFDLGWTNLPLQSEYMRWRWERGLEASAQYNRLVSRFCEDLDAYQAAGGAWKQK